MNAPDKIYLNKYMIRPGMLYPAQYPADTPEFEYIRKDALLEKIVDMIVHSSDGSLAGYYESIAYNDIRELIESM